MPTSPVGGGVRAALDYDPEDLLGRRIEDIAAPDLAAGTPAMWDRFLVDGRQDGDIDCSPETAGNDDALPRSRAHFPIAGFGYLAAVAGPGARSTDLALAEARWASGSMSSAS